MANFHTNYFVVAADEENMCKILWRMAMNLAANTEYTGFSMADVEGLTTARDIYFQVGSALDASYIFAFAGAPIPEDVAEKNVPGWSSPTSSEGGYLMQLSAMMKATEQFNANAPEGVSIGLTVTAPTARAMSDSASVGFTKYGENWVLSMMYDTAWRPNSEDLDVFFMGLPEGNYGVAFFDADEYDGYETVNTFSGLHHGLAGMQSFDDEGSFDVLESSDLKAQKRECAGMSKSSIDDIAKLARVAAISGWNQFGWDEDEDDGYGYDYYSDDGEAVNLWDRPAVNWRNPSAKDEEKIVSSIVDVMAALPLALSVGYGFTKEGNDAVEKLLPGDTVQITGEWDATDFRALKVSTVEGAQIGYTSGWVRIVEDYEINRIALGILALILPHIKATVSELTPVSLRNTGVEGPSMGIRLNACIVDFDEVMDEVRALLERDCPERALSSSVEEAM